MEPNAALSQPVVGRRCCWDSLSYIALSGFSRLFSPHTARTAPFISVFLLQEDCPADTCALLRFFPQSFRDRRARLRTDAGTSRLRVSECALLDDGPRTSLLAGDDLGSIERGRRAAALGRRYSCLLAAGSRLRSASEPACERLENPPEGGGLPLRLPSACLPPKGLSLRSSSGLLSRLSPLQSLWREGRRC